MEMPDGAIKERRLWDILQKGGVKIGSDCEALVKHFTQLFNASSDEGRIPAEWFTSAVIRVDKGGDSDNWGSYRPVSLTSTTLTVLCLAY